MSSEEFEKSVESVDTATPSSESVDESGENATDSAAAGSGDDTEVDAGTENGAVDESEEVAAGSETGTADKSEEEVDETEEVVD